MTEPVHTDIPITTALELPGRPAGQSLGLVFGLVVRSMGFVKGFTAGFIALRKGEVTQYTEVLEDARTGLPALEREHKPATRKSGWRRFRHGESKQPEPH